MTTITSYHAHVYFDTATLDQARALCTAAAATFPVKMGWMHERPVGPHPMGSCQLSFQPEVFADIIPWLALNRDGLIIFTHPETGNHLENHRDHGIWMGGMPDLKLDMFQ